MTAERTSFTHPLRIDVVQAGAGQIGLTFCPGKVQAQAMTGSWARDLKTDLEAIHAWGARDLVTLIEPFEFDQLQVPLLGNMAAEMGLRWHHAPITDDDIPDERFESVWPQLGPHLLGQLAAGGKVVVHCKGGLGRAGTVATLLLLGAEPNLSSEQAVGRVRRAREGALYMPAQEGWVHAGKAHRLLRALPPLA